MTNDIRGRYQRQAMQDGTPRAGAGEDPARDLIVEAGQIARGESMLIGSTAHVRELVDVLGGALRAYVERAQRIGLQPGTFTRAAIAEIDHARAVLARLEGTRGDG